MKITFGKFKGRHVKNIESWYLRWLVANVEGHARLVQEASRVLASREGEPGSEAKRGGKEDGYKKEAEHYRQLYEEAQGKLYDISLDLDVARRQQDTSWWAEWWRRSVKLAHPDRGGNDMLMALLNEANEKMRH